MPRPLRVLLVEDNPADADLIVRELRRTGFDPAYERVESKDAYLARLHPDLDIILSDYSLPQFTGIDALDLLHERGLEIPFIIVSGTIGEDTAVAAMKQGATDYLLKDRLMRLGSAVERALEEARLERQRKQAEAALRESEERFRQLAENIQDVFWMIDLTTNKMLYVSPSYEGIWGRSRDALYASPRNWLDAIHPEDRDNSFGPATANEAGGRYDKEYRIIRPDGSVRWIRDRAFPVGNAVGGVDRVVGVARDITVRRLAEERVHEQAEMLDRAHDAILVRDFHDRTIRFWNKGAENLYGWTAAEAIGSDTGKLIFANGSKLDTIDEQLLKTDEWRGENRHRSKAGKELTVNTRATLVRTRSGEPKSVLSINTDITEQKNIEAQFLRAQRLESIGTLASGVAHDLNNILAPIMMSVPVLRRDLTAEQREGILATIETSAARGAEIIKQVLTFGSGVSGERRPLQLGTVLNELITIMAETFPKDITVASSVAPALWQVIGDSTQLHQVLLNLCLNARDAMPDGGSLQLRASNLELDATSASMLSGATAGPHVLLEVIDNGTGIPPEIMERIFDPFFTTKGVGKGTGLGLSTALGIVKSHGGHIQVTSDPASGTAFQIYLPASKDLESEADGRNAPATPPDGHGAIVLVVDDEKAVRNASQAVLEHHGYRVLLAADGTEALTIFAQNSAGIAAVLTDLMMPNMDGVALIQALRKMNPDLPVIASTGLGEKAQFAKLKALNVKTVLRKPYDARTLLRSMHEVLHRAADR